jgi:hypothetical protein
LSRPSLVVKRKTLWGRPPKRRDTQFFASRV